MRGTATASLLLLAAACGHAQSGAYVTGRLVPPFTGAVEISATLDPESADEVGVIEVHGRLPADTIETLVIEFRRRVASMGGDYGRIDSFATLHEMVTENQDYECGSFETEIQALGSESTPAVQYVSKTCTEQRRVEAATRTLVGRAFRTPRRNP